MKLFRRRKPIETPQFQDSGKDLIERLTPKEYKYRDAFLRRVREIMDMFHYEEKHEVERQVRDLGQIVSGKGDGPLKFELMNQYHDLAEKFAEHYGSKNTELNGS